MIRKREPRWQSAAERARVAAELMEEAQSLTDTSTIASPADVARARLPPPLHVELPSLPPLPPPPAPTPELGAAAPTPPGAPTEGEALLTLGLVFVRKGLWSEAVPRLRRAAEVDPGRAAAWYYLGEALNHVDDLAGARAAYERAVELEPRNGKALYGLGIVLDRLQRPDEATRMYRRSREAAGR